MKEILWSWAGAGLFSVLLGIGFLTEVSAQPRTKTPLNVMTNIRVDTSEPRIALWQRLPLPQKELAYHLHLAAIAGRKILFQQNHRHGLFLKRFFDHTLAASKQSETETFLTASGFQEFLAYAAKFQDLASPYSPSNRKYVLRTVSPTQVRTLVRGFVRQAHERFPDQKIEEVVRLLTDPTYEVLRQPEDAQDELAETGGNLYAKGITSAEVRRALRAGLKLDLNCQIIRGANRRLKCQRQTTQTTGPVGEALREVVAELRLALPFAHTEHQRREIDYFIRYFRHGHISDFRRANIEWVRDRTASTVDFMMGFVEVYEDFNGRIGSWESYVQIVDPANTQVAQALASNAQYFEDQMPYGPWKKTFPENYSPPALMVYYFQEIASLRTSGYNLPNYDDIRRDVGAKNVIRLDLPGAAENPILRTVYEEAYRTFMPADLVEQALRYREKQWRVLVNLHEIIGHGSGIFDVRRYGPEEDPISALGAAGGSALEEQRADLAALVFAADPKLIDVGLYQDAAEAQTVRNVMYDTYVASLLLRLSQQETFSESHSRGHWLLVKRLLDAGAVEWVGPSNERQLLRVKNYEGFKAASSTLLAELQRIKAVRDETALRALLAQDAPLEAVNEPWARSTIAAGRGLALNAGVVSQPWRITRTSDPAERFRVETLGGTTLRSIAPYW